jgi:hypothetical protein
MHLVIQIWEFFQLALSSHHIMEFPHNSTFCVYVTINSWTPGKTCPISNSLRVAHTSTYCLDFVQYIDTVPIQILSFMFISEVGINVILNCRFSSSGRCAVPVPTRPNDSQLEINTRGRRHGGDNDIPLG